MSTPLEATQEQTDLVNEQPEMTEAATVEVAEQEAAPVEEDDAAFMAGFNQAAGIDTPPESEPAAAEPEPDPEPQPAPEPKQIAGYTEDQIKDLLAKAAEVDRLRETQAKLSGTLGAMRQSIDALKSRPAQQQVSLNKEQFKRLREVFPEMADALVDDLNGALTGGVAAPAMDVSVIEQQVNSRLEQTSRAFETKLLTVQHPDWQEVVQGEAFQAWKQTLDEQTRAELDDSWDATFIGSKLTEFKGWKSKTAQSQQQQQVKRKRLEAAITPKSSAAPAAPTEDDAFLAGFKQARGIR